MSILFRFHAHFLLAEHIYPTTGKILVRILIKDADFPIRSTTSLWRWIRKIGFVYKRVSKVVVPLDTSARIAACARYFAIIDELRTNGSRFVGMMKHDAIRTKKSVLLDR
jgi:hypothetical protein